MASYEPIPLSAVLAARKEGNPLGPPPRDDVGIVLRDMGAGAWRGLLVRKLGSTEGFWYDESVLLPASQDDVSKQVARKGAAYVPPRNVQVRSPIAQNGDREASWHSIGSSSTNSGYFVFQAPTLCCTVSSCKETFYTCFASTTHPDISVMSSTHHLCLSPHLTCRESLSQMPMPHLACWSSAPM
jgi:hypothetical protein